MERPRCLHCRNPIKEHQAATGPAEGERSYHEDCWPQAQQDPVAAGPGSQEDYQRRIASDGLAALLSPYVSVFPGQREQSGQPVDA